jgi:signal transduction histidine kinase
MGTNTSNDHPWHSPWSSAPGLISALRREDPIGRRPGLEAYVSRLTRTATGLATVGSMATTAAPRRWLPKVDPRLLDAVVAAAMLAILVTSISAKAPEPGQHGGDAPAYLLAVALCVPYVFHRRYPMAVFSVVMASLVVFSLRHYAAFPGLSVFVLLFAIALHTDRRRALVTLVISLVAFSVALIAQPPGVADGSTWTSTLLAVAVSWLAGENLRSRRARWAALEERTIRLEHEREERTRQAVAAERLRIARELHDVVAHSMSVIAVQSGVGNHVIDTQPDEARRALQTIETTSRTALTEMRRLLGVLRQDGESQASLEPAPGLLELPQLIAQVAGAGLVATLDVEGDRQAVPPGVDLSAYRIVQEALTNVVKHGGETATVRVRYGDGGVSVEIVDDGPQTTAADAAYRHPISPGHGLIGMRERVAVFGGDFSAARRPGGGFRVAARLPFEVST